MYLEEVLTNGDSRLIGYVGLVQSFASEIPFFYFANNIVERIGVKGSMNLVLLAFSLRYLLYTLFTTSTAYYILFVDLLNGVTFGLFYYSMNSLAGDYSKKMAKVELDYRIKCSKDNEVNRDEELIEDDSAFATMQGVMCGAFEGVGCALGSLLSGIIIQHFGWWAVWYLSSGMAFVVFLLDLAHLTIVFLKNQICGKQGEKEYTEPNLTN